MHRLCNYDQVYEHFDTLKSTALFNAALIEWLIEEWEKVWDHLNPLSLEKFRNIQIPRQELTGRGVSDEISLLRMIAACISGLGIEARKDATEEDICKHLLRRAKNDQRRRFPSWTRAVARFVRKLDAKATELREIHEAEAA